MRRLCLSILMTAVLIFPLISFAADGGQQEYQVTYNGSTLEDNFNGDAINDRISGMEPGDTETFSVNVINNAGETDWYISNEVISSFEDNERASGGAYSYRLTYKPAGGEEKELYSSSTVGGESTVSGVGLHQVPEDMKNFFYLDTMGNGATGIVTMEVGLDGETQGNIYQDANSSLALQFAVDTRRGTTSASTQEPEASSQDKQDKEKGTDQASGTNTGDEANLMPFAIVMMISGLVLLLLAILTYRRMKKEGSGNEEI